MEPMNILLNLLNNLSFDIVKNISRSLNPGGILCLIDLDCNCLRYFGLPERLDKATAGLMKRLEKNCNFDPYVGVKLYSFLYDLGFKDIDVNLSPHNLIFGKLKENQKFNWAMVIRAISMWHY